MERGTILFKKGEANEDKYSKLLKNAVLPVW